MGDASGREVPMQRDEQRGPVAATSASLLNEDLGEPACARRVADAVPCDVLRRRGDPQPADAPPGRVNAPEEVVPHSPRP